VILEAGAMGRAVVATAVGGIPEIIASPDLGRLVPPDDPDRLAEEMAVLLDDAPLRVSLGNHLRGAVQSQFSVRSMNDGYARLLFPQYISAAYANEPLS
jgi:glycosyltransferase involved in cell wall biosynthesis